MSRRRSAVRRLLAGATGLVLVGGFALTSVTEATAAPPNNHGVTVSAAVRHDTSKPLREMKATPAPHREIPELKLPNLLGTANTDPVNPGSGPAPRTLAVQSKAPTGHALAGAGASFDALGMTMPGYQTDGTPADPNSDVGTTQILETVNTKLGVFDKAGNVVLAPEPVNTLFAGMGGPCEQENDGDPVVRWDSMANRWVVMQFALTGYFAGSGPNYECVAVSTSPDATGSWHRYQYSYDYFNDYGKLGVWPDAYYVTYNQFTNGESWVGAQACALDRSAMLTGGNATQQCGPINPNFAAPLPADLDGSTPPPVGAPNYELSLDGWSALVSWKFHVDWANTANTVWSGPVSIPVTSYNPACSSSSCVMQPSPGVSLDGLGDRLMFPLQYRNFGAYGALTVTHAVTVGNVVGERWYELHVDQTKADTTPAIYQQGTFSPNDGLFRWTGSAAMDKAGDIALGYTESSMTTYPSIAYTGRGYADPLGQMTQTEQVVRPGVASETGQYGRWGDYSSMDVDPTDDCTFWYTHMFFVANDQYSWGTHISSARFDNCTSQSFSVAASSDVVTTQNGVATTTVTTSTTAGAAQNVALSVTGLPPAASVSFSPPTVTSGGASTLTIHSNSLPSGNYPVTVVAQGTSERHTTSFTLTVRPDFSVSVQPSSQTLSQPGAQSATASTAVTAGSPEPVQLALSGVPAGASATVSPSTVTSGQSATLTFDPGTAQSGTYPVTVTGTDAAQVSHSATYTVTIGSDFSVSIDPTAQTYDQPGQLTASVGTAPTLGSPGTLSLSLTGAPDGASAAVSPSTVTSGQSATLTFDPGTAASGTYPLTLTASDANSGVTHRATYTVTIGKQFTVATTGGTTTANATSPAVVHVDTADTFGSPATLDLTASGLPAGAHYTFDPQSVPAGGNATLSIDATGVADGRYQVTVTATDHADPSHSLSTPVTLVVDRTRPAAGFTGTAHPFVVATSTAVGWVVSDGGTGPAGADVRWRSAASGSAFGAWPATPQWVGLTATGSRAKPLSAGTTTCLEVRGHDRAGNVGAWSAQRCISVPLDDRALSASKGWTRVTGTAYWQRTATTTRSKGVTLKLGTRTVTQLALVANRCTGCGSVVVKVGSTVVGTIKLAGTAATRQLFVLPRFAARTGVISLTTTSTKPVTVDGLGLTRT